MVQSNQNLDLLNLGFGGLLILHSELNQNSPSPACRHTACLWLTPVTLSEPWGQRGRSGSCKKCVVSVLISYSREDPSLLAWGMWGPGETTGQNCFCHKNGLPKDRQPRPRVTPAVLQLTQQVPVMVGVRQTRQTSNCCVFLSP